MFMCESTHEASDQHQISSSVTFYHACVSVCVCACVLTQECSEVYTGYLLPLPTLFSEAGSLIEREACSAPQLKVDWVYGGSAVGICSLVSPQHWWWLHSYKITLQCISQNTPHLRHKLNMSPVFIWSYSKRKNQHDSDNDNNNGLCHMSTPKGTWRQGVAAWAIPMGSEDLEGISSLQLYLLRYSMAPTTVQQRETQLSTIKAGSRTWLPPRLHLRPLTFSKYTQNIHTGKEITKSKNHSQLQQPACPWNTTEQWCWAQQHFQRPLSLECPTDQGGK